MTNIFLKLFDLEIKNKQIIKEKDRSVQKIQGALEKEQKLKTNLQDRKNENIKVLAKVQVVRQNIDDIPKHNKDLENIKMERDSLQATSKETNANYQGLKTEKDTLSIKHNKLQRDYRHMEKTFLKQQKEVEELKVDNTNAYQAKNEVQRQADQRHAQMDRNLQKQMAFNEKLNKLLEETQKKKPFKYDTIFVENSEFNKQNTLLQGKLKVLSMEEKDVDLWWDAVQDIVQKDIGKVYRKYERSERWYKHIISQMEKFMPSFEYEP